MRLPIRRAQIVAFGTDDEDMTRWYGATNAKMVKACLAVELHDVCEAKVGLHRLGDVLPDPLLIVTREQVLDAAMPKLVNDTRERQYRCIRT